MVKKLRRTPRGYSDTLPTSKNLSEILPEWLEKVSKRFDDRPDLVLLAWPEVIGSTFASMAHAVSFIDGVLTVKVKNSSLYSLLVQHEKPRLLKELQTKLPSSGLKDIIFRLG